MTWLGKSGEEGGGIAMLVTKMWEWKVRVSLSCKGMGRLRGRGEVQVSKCTFQQEILVLPDLNYLEP